MKKQTITLAEFKTQFRAVELKKEGKNYLTDEQIEGAYNVGATINQIINGEEYAKFVATFTGDTQEEAIKEVIDQANENGLDDKSKD